MTFVDLPRPRTPGAIDQLATRVMRLQDSLAIAGLWPWRASDALAGRLFVTPRPQALEIHRASGRVSVEPHPMCRDFTAMAFCEGAVWTLRLEQHGFMLSRLNDALDSFEKNGDRVVRVIVSPRIWTRIAQEADEMQRYIAHIRDPDLD